MHNYTVKFPKLQRDLVQHLPLALGH